MSASMWAMRSAGYSGSTGTYPAPALTTASSETTRSMERGRATATNRSGPAPWSTSSRANRLARALSRAYDSSSSSKTTATASGVRAACASNSSGSVASGTGRAVSFHSLSTRRRSAGSRTSMALSGRSGRAATAVSTLTRRPARARAVSWSKRSVLNSSTPPMPAGAPSAVGRSPSENSRSKRATPVPTRWLETATSGEGPEAGEPPAAGADSLW